MNYSLGATDTLTNVSTGVETTASGVSSLASSIASYAATAKALEAQIATATSTYEQAVLEQELAIVRKKQAELEAQMFKENLPLYIAAIGGGVLLIGGIVLYGAMKK